MTFPPDAQAANLARKEAECFRPPLSVSNAASAALKAGVTNSGRNGTQASMPHPTRARSARPAPISVARRRRNSPSLRAAATAKWMVSPSLVAKSSTLPSPERDPRANGKQLLRLPGEWRRSYRRRWTGSRAIRRTWRGSARSSASIASGFGRLPRTRSTTVKFAVAGMLGALFLSQLRQKVHRGLSAAVLAGPVRGRTRLWLQEGERLRRAR